MRFEILLRLSGCENVSGTSRNGPEVELKWCETACSCADSEVDPLRRLLGTSIKP